MNIHEYQVKEILRGNGIPVPPGEVATTPDEAVSIAEQYGGTVVVKAQVHSGGRGKAGGVKLATTTAEVRAHAEAILGMTISDLTVEKILITPAEDIDTEAYVGILVDRKAQAATFMVSAEGGIDIEEVAHTNPDAIRKLTIDPRYGLMTHQAYWLANSLYDDPDLVKQAAKIIHQLYAAFTSSGASMIEINPLITTNSGEVKAIDAKMSIDDSELFRRPALVEYRDLSAETGCRDQGPGSRSQLRQAGRECGLLRQRSRAGHGHHGPREVLRRRACQFSGYWRLVESGKGRHRAGDHYLGSECEGHPVQHFRGDYAL